MTVVEAVLGENRRRYRWLMEMACAGGHCRRRALRRACHFHVRRWAIWITPGMMMILVEGCRLRRR